jgi:CHAD domain-containing protein
MAIGSDPNVSDDAGSIPATVDRVKLVHEARKTIKRMRALARLLRYELGEQEFERVNGMLRIAGQRLAGARDADVRIATLQRLVACHPKALATEGVRLLAIRLTLERERASEPADPQDVLADIAEMRSDLAHWNLVDPDLKAVSPGLERIYGEGRRRYARVKREHGRDAEHMHSWRKRVKALYYALDILGSSEAEGVRGMTRRAKRLGDLLGEEHDLWMLRAYLERHPDACGRDASNRETLLRAIESDRKRLGSRAIKKAKRLYKRKPGRFARRVGDSLSR